jgi:hypothetical protein
MERSEQEIQEELKLIVNEPTDNNNRNDNSTNNDNPPIDNYDLLVIQYIRGYVDREFDPTTQALNEQSRFRSMNCLQRSCSSFLHGMVILFLVYGPVITALGTYSAITNASPTPLILLIYAAPSLLADIGLIINLITKKLAIKDPILNTVTDNLEADAPLTAKDPLVMRIALGMQLNDEPTISTTEKLIKIFNTQAKSGNKSGAQSPLNYKLPDIGAEMKLLRTSLWISLKNEQIRLHPNTIMQPTTTIQPNPPNPSNSPTNISNRNG